MWRERFCEGARYRTPCVNVKVPPFYHRLPLDVRDQDPDSEIYNMTAEDWWETVPSDLVESVLAPAFPDSDPEIYREGRSGGWLCVAGIGLPEDWDEAQRDAWSRFAEQIRRSIDDYVCVYVDNVRLNRLTTRGLVSPHGRCAFAGICVEHEANPRLTPCRCLRCGTAFAINRGRGLVWTHDADDVARHAESCEGDLDDR